MFTTTTIMLYTVIILALAFDFINGFHDTANSIATSISTRALSPKYAIAIAATFNFIGALASDKVAATISKGIVRTERPLEQYVIISALIAAIIWNIITWYFGIPSSSSHALIGGLVGSTIVYTMSLENIVWNGVLQKVVFPLFTSPIIGFIFGFLIMKLFCKLFEKMSQQHVNRNFTVLQWLSAAFMSFSHGSNDAQKSMGIITLALFSAGMYDTADHVPMWVKFLCAITMAAGTSVGGWKIIKTIGVNMIKLKPVGGFSADLAGAIVIETASQFGAPVSTTHVISSSIMGVGTAKRASAVRWSIAKSIVSAWFMTLPIAAVMGGLVTYLFTLFLK